MAIFMTAVTLTPSTRSAPSDDAQRAAARASRAASTALSRTELTLVFPLVVIPLALLARSRLASSASSWPWSRASSAGSCSRPWIVFNYTPVRGDHHDDQRHRRGVVGGQLRRGLVRQATSATTRTASRVRGRSPRSTSRNATWCRASRPSSTPRITSSAAPARGGRPRRTPVGPVQARPDHRARLVDRGPRSRPDAGSGCSPTTRCCRSPSAAWW